MGRRGRRRAITMVASSCLSTMAFLALPLDRGPVLLLGVSSRLLPKLDGQHHEQKRFFFDCMIACINLPHPSWPKQGFGMRPVVIEFVTMRSLNRAAHVCTRSNLSFSVQQCHSSG